MGRTSLLLHTLCLAHVKHSPNKTIPTRFLYPARSRPLNQAEWLGALISPHSFKHRAGCTLATATPPEGRAQDCQVRQLHDLILGPSRKNILDLFCLFLRQGLTL